MRVALVAQSGLTNASTRYRCTQFADRLRDRFSDVDVFLPPEVPAPSDGLISRGRFFARHARSYEIHRRQLLREIPRYDAVFVQRGAYPLGPAAVVAGLERFSGRLVFDLDDAVFVPRPSMAGRGRAARWIHGPQQSMHLLRRADVLVVSTKELAAALPQPAPPIEILPTLPDCSRVAPRAHHETPNPKIAWVGNAGNLVYLDPLSVVLTSLAAKGLPPLEVVCSKPWPGPSTFRRWTLEEEATVFADYDVQIMPLPDTPYTRAKAGFKLLQSMAAGVPVVASPVGINRELIEASGGGLTASTPDEWAAALDALCGDANLRRSLGHRGRRFVEEYADLDRAADVLARALDSAASSRSRYSRGSRSWAS